MPSVDAGKLGGGGSEDFAAALETPWNLVQNNAECRAMADSCFYFDDFALDTDRRELRRGDERVALGPQVFDLLAYLVRNRARVVSKDDILEAVWKGRIVSESTLTSHINAVRKALGDSGEAQRFVRTMQRKGIRFVGEVRGEGRPPALPSVAPTILALPDRPSIAVLPFTNMSGDPDQEYFADGMTEDLITALSRWRWFFVIARNSTFTYKGRSVDVREVGRQLGVRYVLEGSVRLGRLEGAASRIRITAQLIDAGNGAHLWAERYDGVMDDVFDLQDRISASIVAAIEPQLRSAEMQRIHQKRPENLDAYDYYLQALPHFYNQTRQGNDQARSLLARAVECDAGYALAHALLAYCSQQRRQQGWTESFAAEQSEGLRHAERALACGGDNPAVLWIVGYMFTILGLDRERGRVLIDRSLSLNVNDAQAWCVSGWNHSYSGEGQNAIDDLERAIRLSPLDPMAHWFHAGIAAGNMVLGQFDRMAAAASLAVQLGPNDSRNWRFLAVALAHSGRKVEAAAAVRRLVELEPGVTLSSARARVDQVEPRTRKVFLEGLRLAGLPG